MKLIVFTAACMIIAAVLLLVGAYCHQGIEAAVSWLRKVPAFRSHEGHHVAGAVLAAGVHPCCEHCEDGSPCEPRDSHREQCFDCPVPYVPADVQVQARADLNAQYAAWVYGVKPVRSEGPQPWATGAQDALTDEVEAAIEAAQEKRAQLASSVLRQLAASHDDRQPTGEDMQATLVALRAVPVPGPYEAPAACAPELAHGQVPVAEVLESERLAEVMQQ
jgi:hypothetical protein